MGIVGNLTLDQLHSFDSQGFLIMESFARPEEIEAMRKKMDKLLQDFDPSTTALFSPPKIRLKLTSEYFYESAEKISFFFEGYRRPVVIQSMYIFKQPGIGGEVTPHQDNSFLYTEPKTCNGLWLALEDATVVNGCLWAIPESQKKGLVRRFIRGEDGVYFDQPSPSYDQKDFVPIEVKAGLVVIHGDLIH